jgi:dTDP-glucose 4,6-dehydratase
MKIVITGCAGFIGGHVAEWYLNNTDASIIGIDSLSYAGDESLVSSFTKNDRFTFYKQDLSRAEETSKIYRHHNPDITLHLAAETHVDNSISNCYPFVDSNIKGTVSILEACKGNNSKLCLVSTDEVYGPAYDRAFKEIDQLNPQNPYAVTKAASEMMTKAYKNTYGNKAIILRLCNNYGPRQNREKFIPKLLMMIEADSKFPLYGDGLQEREWLYVKDTPGIIHSLVLKEQNWNCDVYNISSNITDVNTEVIKKVCSIYNELYGSALKFDDIVSWVTDRPGHDRKYWIDSEKSNSITNFEYTSLVAGLRETIQSYKDSTS